MNENLRLWTLGGLHITCDDQPVTGFDSRKVQALLVYIVCTGRTHPREMLAEMLWEEREQAQSLANLRVALTSLRQTVGPFVTITRESVGINADNPIEVDYAVFEARLDDAGTDVVSLAAAMDLYQGDFLAGFYVDSTAFEEWATRERERLRLRAMQALDTLITCYLGQEDYQAGIACATRLLGMDPLREETHRCLMELLWRSGQRGKALAQFETCRQLLMDELGVEPSAKTVELHERITAGESHKTPTTTGAIRSYEIRERIGEGGFGEVYRAWQPVVQREVAIKVIKPEFANHPDFIRRFETEAQVIAHLEHLHIVPLYDYWREPDGAFLVMRWLPENLKQRLERGPLPLRACVRLVEQICAALAVAHRAGVVHRDLKPANILLDAEGNAYLADFGIAKVLGPAAERTKEGVMIGSPAYLAPEQIRCEPVTPQSDLYSFGVVLFEALTGQSPFLSNLAPSQILYKQLNDPLLSLATIQPNLPTSLDDVIQQVTAKEPSQRYPDALSLAAAFRAAAGGAQLIPSPEIAVAKQTAALPDERTWTPADELVAVRNPYKGLRAFTEADTGDFFGREGLVNTLLERLAEDKDLAHFLAVVGPSGSGKSSEVRAGLVPALRDGRLPGSDDWFIAQMLPGPHPLDEVELALTRIAASPGLSMLPLLCEDERGLLRAVRQVLPPDSTLLLVIDQFEEIFTLVEDPSEARHLMESLYTAVTDPRSPLRIIITLRADFYDRPLMHPHFSQLVRHRTEVVVPMLPEELEAAVSLPAEGVNITLEPGLTAAIVAEVHEQPGALPLLQYALTELFDQRSDHVLTLDAYTTLGGVQGALARRAEEVYAGLSDAEQEAARQLFLRLVTLGEGAEDTRRRTLQSELLSVGGNTMQRVIDVYDRSRLLTFDRDPVTRGPTIEVAHEALLREWSQLREWLDDSRHDVRLQRLLAAATSEWEQAGRNNDYLLSGSRLDQFEGWSVQTDVALTQDEQEYLEHSVASEKRSLARRRRVRNTILAAAIAVALVMTVLAFFALDERSSAEEARDEAEREAEVRQSVALAVSAKEALNTHDTDLAVALALEANNIPNPPPEARQALAAAVYAPGTRRVMVGHEDAVNSVAISPDGRYALSGGGRPWHDEVRGVAILFPDAEYDCSVRLWDLTTGKEIRRFEGHQDGVLDVAFSPDGQYAVSGSSDHTAIVWDINSGEVVQRIEADLKIRSVAFSPDGQTLLIGLDTSGVIELWDIQSGEVLHHLVPTEAFGNVWDVQFSPDGQYVLAGIGELGFPMDGSIILWDVESGEQIYQKDMPAAVRDVIFQPPDGRFALVTAYNVLPETFGMGMGTSIMILMDVETGQEVRRFRSGWAGITGIAVSPDGRLAVTAATDQMLIVWDVETGEMLRQLTGHSDWLIDVVFSPDSAHLLTASEDGTLRYWDLRHGAEARRLEGHSGRIFDIAFSPDGRTAVTGGSGRELFVWDVSAGTILQRLQGYKQGVNCVWFAPDGRSIVSGAFDSVFRRWDAATGEETGYAYLDTQSFACGVSADGRYVLFPATGGNAAITTWNMLYPIYFDLETGEIIRRLQGHTQQVWSVAISPDGRYGLTGSADDTVRYWDLLTGEELCIFREHRGGVLGVAFSPDGRYGLSGSTDRTMVLWDLEHCKEVRRFEGHSLRLTDMVFSPDGRTALSTAEDRLMIQWDLTTGEEIQRFDGHDWAAWSVAINPDGQYALSGSEHGELILWRLNDSPEEIIAWAYENRYVRDLSCTERETFNVTPLCDGQMPLPTWTPYPTLTPSLVPSVTPTRDLTKTPPSPTWTPLPSNTPPPTATFAPTSTPEPKGTLTFDVPATGMISLVGGALSTDSWTFTGTEGQVISITISSVDTSVAVYAPDASLIEESTAATIGPMTLPVTGTYMVVVQAGSMNVPGMYTIEVTESSE